MKYQTKKQNPILKPLPLLAMSVSTLAMIATAFFSFAYKPAEYVPQSRTIVRYACENCGLRNVFNNPLENKPEQGKDNSSNFRPVIVKITQGRYRHVIETERLLLREITLDDLPAIHQQCLKVENASSATWRVHTSIEKTKKKILKFMEDDRRGIPNHWAVCLKSTGQLIGTGGIFGYVAMDHRATMGWGFDSDFWGNGYATELGRACVEYGMKYLHLNRIDAVVRVDNIASRKVLEKIGMSLSATFRQYWRVKDELLSHYQFVILKKDIAAQLKKSKV